MAEPAQNLIRAAGGVVIRTRKSGRQVVVVHRRAHDDWSLPKGKIELGESWEEAALREVYEETAVEASIEALLDPTAYLVGRRPKIVVWFSMAIIERHVFVPNAEVDEIRWVAEAELASALTLGADVAVASQALRNS